MRIAVVFALLVALASPAGAAEHVPDDHAGFAFGYQINTWPQTKLDAAFADIASTGQQWVRPTFDWSAIQTAPTVFDWSTPDRIVISAVAHGLQVDALIAYTPEWARAAGTNGHYPPINPQDFGAFAGLVAARYGSYVTVYEIWNEPNVAQFWQPAPDPTGYAWLHYYAANAIRAADPTSYVMTGGMAPAADTATSVKPATFLTALYSVGLKPWFDGVGFHPYSYPAFPSTVAPWNAWQQIGDLRAVMAANGDTTKLLSATEYGAPTGTVTRSDQARMIREARDLWPVAAGAQMGLLLLFEYSDPCTGPDPECHFGIKGKRAWTEVLR